ncbi:hypothetical protein GQ457_03G011380 [Hibiscus cannabinus]
MTVTLDKGKNKSAQHPYGTRRKTKMVNEDRLKKIEQDQKELQDDLVKKMEDQLAKARQDMTEQIKNSQQEMLGQLAQMLGFQLGEAFVINPPPKPSNESEGPTFPPGFTPIQAKMQTENQPQVILSRGKAPLNQVGASVPGNIPSAPKDFPGENQAENFVSEMDQLFETEKLKTETSKEIEDRCKRLEEKLEALEVVDTFSGFEANELSLVPDLILPPKFKVPEFEKYDGTSCPRTHLTMFCRRMTGYGRDDNLLVHCFQDSLSGSATRWYNQLSRHQIKSWKDLAKAFLEQYKHVSDMVPDRLTLQHMKQKPNESFRQYAQRWRDVAVQVQPPLGEKETVVIFIQTLEGPILDRLIGNATTNFADLVLSGELIENAVKSGKIDSGGSSSHRKTSYGKKDHEVNSSGVYNVGYSKSVTISQPDPTAATTPSSKKPESNSSRPIREKLSITPIPVTYGELFPQLLKEGLVAVNYVSPLQPPYPHWYKPDAHCDFHGGIPGHNIETCITFKRVVQNLLNAGIVSFEKPKMPNTAKNPLPNHEGGVNVISEENNKIIKADVSKIKSPFSWVWRRLFEAKIINQGATTPEGHVGPYCEFHGEDGHAIKDCWEFRVTVQALMDNKEIEFFGKVDVFKNGTPRKKKVEEETLLEKWLTLNNGENRARNKKEGDEDVLIQEKRIVDTTPLQERRSGVPLSKISIQERMIVDVLSFQERRSDAFKEKTNKTKRRRKRKRKQKNSKEKTKKGKGVSIQERRIVGITSFQERRTDKEKGVSIQERRIVDITSFQERRTDVPFSKVVIQKMRVADVSPLQERRSDTLTETTLTKKEK